MDTTWKRTFDIYHWKVLSVQVIIISRFCFGKHETLKLFYKKQYWNSVKEKIKRNSHVMDYILINIENICLISLKTG